MRHVAPATQRLLADLRTAHRVARRRLRRALQLHGLQFLELRRSLRLTLHRYRVELLLARRSLHPFRLRLQGLHTLTLQSLARRRVERIRRHGVRRRQSVGIGFGRKRRILRVIHRLLFGRGIRLAHTAALERPCRALRRALESLSPPGRSAVRTICIYIVRIALSCSDRVRNGRSNRVGTLLGRRNREKEHRVGTHEDRIALHRIVAHNRRIERQQRVARMLPVLNIVAEGKYLVIEVVHLDVAARNHMLILAVVVDRVAPHLLILRQHIPLARNLIALPGLVVGALLGREIVAVGIPYLAAREETRRLARDVVYDRIALHVVVRAVHLHILHAHHIVRVGIVIPALRLDDVVVVEHHAAARITANLLPCVETEIVGIEQRVAVNDLHDRGVDLRQGVHAVVDGTVAVDIDRILIYDDTSEKAHLRIAVTHGAVADDNRTVMMCGKVAREADYTVTAVVVGAHLVGHEVDLAGLRTPRAVTPQTVLPRCRQCLLPRPLRRRARSLRRRGSGTAMRRRLRQKQTRKKPDNRYDTAHASKLFLSLSHDPPGRASGAGSEADSPNRGYFTQFLYSKSPLRNSGSI